MPPALATDPILKRFRTALDEIYGDRLERVVLFGSKARGDAGEDSDYDIAVFLKDLKEGDLDTRWRELDRLADLRSAILSDTEAFSVRHRSLHRRQAVPRRRLPQSNLTDGRDSPRRRRSVTAPEVREHLEKTRECLAGARIILGTGIGEDAGRNAYLVGFIHSRRGSAARHHRPRAPHCCRARSHEPGLARRLRRCGSRRR